MRLPAWVSRLRALVPRVPDEPLARFLKASGVLALVGLSLALAVCQLDERFGAAFIDANQLGAGLRVRLLAGMGAGAALGLLLAAGLLWIRPAAERLTRVVRVARLLSPLILAGAVPALLRPSAWSDALTLCLIASAFVVLLEALLRQHFAAYAPAAEAPTLLGSALRRRLARLGPLLERAGPLLRSAPAAGIALFAFGYAAYMGYWVVQKHYSFQSYTWDLGQFDNLFANALHGHPNRCTALSREGDWSDLRGHAHLGIYWFLPLYALRPAAETLLVLQVLMVAAGGVALYRFAARRLPGSVALALSAAYYLYPPLHGAQFFDIHFQVMAIPLVLWAIDCFDTKRMLWFTLFFVMALTCREDISIGTACFGLFVALSGERVRTGLVVFVVSAVYFVALRFVIMPAVGPWGFSDIYQGLYPESQRSFAGVIFTMVTNPLFTLKTMLSAEKLRYFLLVMAPMAFLPLRRPYLWLSLAPGAISTLLTTGYPATLDIAYQYSGHFVLYCFPAAALALHALSRQPAGLVARRAAVGSLLAATFVFTTHYGAIPPRENFRSAYSKMRFETPTPELVRRRQALHEMVAMVPADAILAATDAELPHVSNRTECWNLSVGFEGSDYILYTKVNPAPAERTMFKNALRAGYQQIADREGLVLLRRPGAR